MPPRVRRRAGKAGHVDMALYEVQVRQTCRLSRGLIRVTLHGDKLREFADDGPDQRVKLLIPNPGQARPRTPDPDNWHASLRDMPDAQRPIVRTYTVRSARPRLAEVDIDVVLHDPPGPGSLWAQNARPGDITAIHGARAEYETPPTTARQLLAGDHTALPAIAAICERLAPEVSADVIIEVPSAGDRLPFPGLPAGVRLTWLVSEHPRRAGRALLDAVTTMPTDSVWDYAWIAADAETVRELRRHLLAVRGMPAAQIAFMGYWRNGFAEGESASH